MDDIRPRAKQMTKQTQFGHDDGDHFCYLGPSVGTVSAIDDTYTRVEQSFGQRTGFIESEDLDCPSPLNKLLGQHGELAFGTADNQRTDYEYNPALCPTFTCRFSPRRPIHEEISQAKGKRSFRAILIAMITR
jgi:hypothetical protein